MDVLAAREGGDQPGVGGEVGDAAQLDLVVVGDEQDVAGRRHEDAAELTALVSTHRDVVQVRAVRAEPTGAGDGLVERGVDPTVGRDLEQQSLAVGAAQLLDLAVLQQRADELRPLVLQLLQRRRVGRRAGLRLLDRDEPVLAEQDLAQLDRRVDVEVLVPGDHPQVVAQPCRVGGQLLVQLLEERTVDGDADVLHPGEDDDERVLDRRVQRRHALLVEQRRDRLDEGGDRQRVAGRARTSAVTCVPPRSSCPLLVGSSLGAA